MICVLRVDGRLAIAGLHVRPMGVPSRMFRLGAGIGSQG